MGSWAEKTCGKAAAGGPRQVWWQLVDQARRWLADWAVPHSHADKPGGATRERDRLHNPGFQYGEIKPQKSLTENTCGG